MFLNIKYLFRKILYVFAIITLTICSKPASAGENRALLIGISQYSDLDNLTYADKDIDEMKLLLIDSAGYQLSDVTVLLNSRATKKNISKAFDKLVQLSKKKYLNHVIIMFSGHGMPNQVIGRKTSIFLAPYDASLANHDFYSSEGLLVNETFIERSWLARKIALIDSETVVLLIDSCYSGIMDFGKRFADNLGFNVDYSISEGSTKAIIITQKINKRGSGPRKVAFLAASSEEKQSVELDQLKHGALSYCLLNSLGSVRMNTFESEIEEISVGNIFQNIKIMFNTVSVDGRKLRDFHQPVLLPIPDLNIVLPMKFVSIKGTRKREKPEEPIKKGIIYIYTKPQGALVQIDGKLTDKTTNCKIELPTGKYHITLIRSQTDYRHSFMAKVNQDQPIRKKISLQGDLKVVSFWEEGKRLKRAHGLEIFLDGKYKGKGKLVINNLPAGTHHLKVKYKEEIKERKIEIRPDSPLTVRYILVRKHSGRTNSPYPRIPM